MRSDLGWRTARRYRRDEPHGRTVLEDLEARLTGLDLLATPVWAFDPARCQCLWANRAGLAVWRAETVHELQERDVASTQSEAVYTLLNDYLARAHAGETVSVWVTLEPRGVKQRYYQSHHPLTLSDGRMALLVEAHAAPPAEELLAFASNHSLTIGLYETDGRLVSHNPAFRELSERNDLSDLSLVLPQNEATAAWLARIDQEHTVRVERELSTERGSRWFRAELRLVSTNTNQRRVVASFFDVTESRLAEAEAHHRAHMERSLREKEALLREVHHRVKNNLQIVASMMRLQKERSQLPEAREVLGESAQRVQAMALIHEQFYGRDTFDSIDFAPYALELTEALRAQLGPETRVSYDLEPSQVSLEIAVPLGLVLNELVGNAFKYGVPARRDARFDLGVRVRVMDGELVVEVRDHGPGLPDGVGAADGGALGFSLVRALTRQVRARFTLESSAGTSATVVCSLRVSAPTQA